MSGGLNNYYLVYRLLFISVFFEVDIRSNYLFDIIIYIHALCSHPPITHHPSPIQTSRCNQQSYTYAKDETAVKE